jgi:hypothetical protein
MWRRTTIFVSLIFVACSSSTTTTGGGGEGKMFASCTATSDCTSGLSCFQNQCLVRLSNSQCIALGDLCESVAPGSGNGVLIKCSDRCQTNSPPEGEKLGDECDNFACFLELNQCVDDQDPNLKACVASKGWT